MTRTENKYSFHFKKLIKSWKQEQKPHVVEFLGYSDDGDLCVNVSPRPIFIAYLRLAERKKNQTQLLLGQIKSHKEAVSSTILE